MGLTASDAGGVRVSSLSDFVRRYPAPLLRSYGFDRSGNSFCYPSSAGDLAILTFRAFPLDRAVITFLIDAGVAPVPYVDSIFRDGRERGRPSPAWCLWRDRLGRDRYSSFQPGVVLGTTEHWEVERGSDGLECWN